jgi:hypothetical protein
MKTSVYGIKVLLMDLIKLFVRRGFGGLHLQFVMNQVLLGMVELLNLQKSQQPY